MLLEFARKKQDYQDKRGMNFLHYAVMHADHETVVTLLKEGYKLDNRDHDGFTPLHLAILAGRTQMAISLLGGINFQIAVQSAKDNQGMTVLMSAALADDIKVAEYLVTSWLAAKQPEDSHLEVAPTDDSSRHSVLRCDPLAQNRQGQTALHISVHNGIPSRVSLFLLQQDGCSKILETLMARQCW